MSSSDLPTDYNPWDNTIGPNGIPRINISAPIGTPASGPSTAAPVATPVPGPALPIENQTNYIMQPDLLDAQQGKADLPDDVAINDAGIPFNKKTGKEIPIVQRPNVLPVAKTPDGYTFAWPKMADIMGSVMSPLAAPAVATKAGEVVLGSGAVRTMQEAPEAVKAANPFYSTLAQAVDNAKINKASPEQWLGYLKNQPGVKSEEIGQVLNNLPNGQISKSELQNIVQQNGVKLNEVVKGELNSLPDGYNIVKGGNGWNVTSPNGGFIASNFPSAEEAKFGAINFLKEVNNLNPTKYHSYQLPGGENYQEMLMSLPERTKNKQAQEIIDAVGRNHQEGLNLQNKYNMTYGQALMTQADKEYGRSTYKSSHWDEPNVIAHVRYNDRNIPENGYSVQNVSSGNKSQVFATQAEAKAYQARLPSNLKTQIIEDQKPLKSLHLEEIQSDWHQAGRKQGYEINDTQKQQLNNIDNKLTTGLSETDIGNPDIDNVLKTAVDKKVITQDEAQKYKEYSKGENSNIPDAPFKSSWPDLAFKRMLHKAAVEGYDSVSWTTGEAQAARYDLSKQLDELIAIKNKDGSYELEGTIKGGGNHKFGSNITEQKLPDLVGKEMAEKISKQDIGPEVYDGDKLKIGGEGMKSFYDKMLVDKANALGKKYGAKVESKDIAKNTNLDIEKSSVKDYPYVVKGDYDNPQFFQTVDDAKAHVDKVRKKQPIHVLKLTPELRAKAAQGFPLFSGTPVYNPVNHNPFQKKKTKLTPIEGNPFVQNQ